MDIGKVAKEAGISTSTLRYYEEKGLIKSEGRNGLRRFYQPDVLDTLALIALGKQAGLSLQEIGTMFLPEGVNIDRQLLLSKADDIDRKIKQMQAISNGLKHAAVCPEESHLQCPTFRRLMNIANKRKAHETSKF